ncbi:hypothetical protein [Lacticaseibacillus hulanensis]|uniref:hypothetical protein n=1 Tax=Lacticaseibacillus hulanensis TaxID=2493111 RepID=UPI000FD97E3B|nr:hypothetical protein [Lacticaseibacillus hulanensis]
MEITDVNSLLSALTTGEPEFNVTGTAAELVSSVLMLRNKTYSPFMQMTGAIEGVLGNLLNHDFSSKVGTQAGTLVQLSPAQQQRFGITPDNALVLVRTANDNYEITPNGSEFTFTIISPKSAKPKAKTPDQYAKYLNKQ